MLVGPLDASSQNAAICGLLGQVGLVLEQSVRRFEVASVQSRTVTDHDLRRVFVRHDYGGLGQLRTH